MIHSMFFTGFIIGVTLAAPIGPISILAIRRSLSEGHHAGIATALGVAIADALYALIAALGLTAISSFLLNKKAYLYGGGGLILILLGIKAFKAPHVMPAQPLKSQGFVVTVIQTTLLTLTNPLTIVTFIAAFAAIGFESQDRSLTESLFMTLGVACGSAAWFILLSMVVSHFRKRLTPFVVGLINKISGSLLIAFGTLFVLNALKNLVHPFFIR
jgi:threonine/homoserine/homoserine lactone efflux protein